MKTLKPYRTILDFITGKPTPNTGSEENRQLVEKFLVEEKDYQRSDIEVDAPIEFEIEGNRYRSLVDLVVIVDGRRLMAIKCVAGSLDSWCRETVSAARLMGSVQVPLSVVSDGSGSIVMDTISGRTIDEGLQAIPDRNAARQMVAEISFIPLPEERKVREKLIFRSYDTMTVNSKGRSAHQIRQA